MKPKAIRCASKNVHKGPFVVKGQTAHNMLLVVDGDCIYAKCPDKGCKRWNRVKITIPGVNLDLSKVAFTQDIMPKGFVFGAETDLYKSAPKRISAVIRES